MVIFHGSERIIENPVFGYGKKHNDYGMGFYCTENRNLAMEWAVEINRDGYANQYDLNIQGFLNNAISVQQLSRAMKYGNLGEQIVLKSERAFDSVMFQKSQVAYSQIWYPQKESRDVMARQQYFNENKNPFKKGEIYMLKILEEEILADDLRI